MPLLRRKRTELFPLLLALTIAAACRGEPVRQLIDETRAPTRIVIEIRLDETAMPDEKELQLRRSIGEEIERRHIGVVALSTADIGKMQLSVDTKDSDSAIPRIHEVLRKFGADDRTTVRIDEDHG